VFLPEEQLRMEPASQKYAQRPDALKNLRACKTCRLIKTASQFHANYCDNCEHTWPDSHNAASRSDYVESNTTNDFEGIVSLFQHSGSWVARWLDMHAKDDDRAALKPGVYAIALPMEDAHAAADAESGRVADEDEAEDGDDDAIDSGGDRALRDAQREGAAMEDEGGSSDSSSGDGSSGSDDSSRSESGGDADRD
jgi:hypothetical protein